MPSSFFWLSQLAFVLPLSLEDVYDSTVRKAKYAMKKVLSRLDGLDLHRY